LSNSPFAKGSLTNAVVMGTVAASWGILAAWTNSPYAAYLGHGELEGVSSLVQLLPLALIFLVGWTFMLFAMMVPAASQFMAQFRLRSRLKGELSASVSGYLAVWALFGLIAYFSDLAIHRLSYSPLLEGHMWVFGTSAIFIASGYQFSSSKNRFLKDCCYPSDFLNSHWGGHEGRLAALRLGFGYGASSVGSGWAVMLLMFALGLGSVVWMAGFAFVMVTESLSQWGPRLRIPVGLALAGVASYSLLVGLGL
jgi:predicted metal-binding membrane protein